MTSRPTRILFLCTGNSCRSQMAEGLTRHAGGADVEVFSAGTVPRAVHPLAIRTMADIGIDISKHESKSLELFLDQEFDFVITVCDRARENCPVWPKSREKIHWSFDDPAEATGTEAERMAVFRRVQGEIKRRVDLFLLATSRADK